MTMTTATTGKTHILTGANGASLCGGPRGARTVDPRAITCDACRVRFDRMRWQEAHLIALDGGPREWLSIARTKAAEDVARLEESVTALRERIAKFDAEISEEA